MRTPASATALNLLTLLIGIAIGFSLHGNVQEAAHAQATASPTVSQQISPTVTATPQQVEEVAPTITFGSAGTGLLLAHEVAADNVVVRGFDLLKLHENTLNYLSRQFGANQVALQQIIESSRAPKVYRLKAPAQEKPKEQRKEEKKP